MVKTIIIYGIITIVCFYVVFRLIWLDQHPEKVAEMDEEVRRIKEKKAAEKAARDLERRRAARRRKIEANKRKYGNDQNN